MQGPPLLRTLAVLLVVALFAPSIPLPSVGADDAPAPPPFRALAGLEGPRATLRLYGCGDSLATAAEPTLATRFHQDEPTGQAPDGRPDCRGDTLHLGSAFLASAREPAHRLALGPRDQTVAAQVRYLPYAWFPGPSHPGGVSDPVDPARGLFDTDDDGALDLVSTADTDTPSDQSPRDGRPDHAARGDGLTGDRYFPALEARYDLVWTAGGNGPVPLPAKASFLLPTEATAGRAGVQEWGTQGKRPVHWHPTPFGFGDPDDATGALHTAVLGLKEGDEVWFLDHGLRVTGFFGSADAPRVGLEVLYNGAGTREVLEDSLVLSPAPSDPTRHATLDHRADQPTNAVFADRTGIDRNVPPFEDPLDPASDAAWFALVSAVSMEEGARTASIRLGRIIGTDAPWNAYVADRLLYRFEAVDERGGALHRLSFASLHPLEAPVQVASAALTLDGMTRDDPFPFLPPFDRDHLAPQDLRPNAARSDAGFLTGTRDGPIASDSLALRPDARTPAERAVTRGPLAMQWRHQAQEDRFVVPIVDVASDSRLTMSAMLPAQYVELVLSDGLYRVDSELLDDTDVVSAAGDASASPRAHRSFLFDPQSARPLFAGPDGLRLASGTEARPDAGDLVRFDPTLLRWDAYGGRIRTPDRLADEVLRLTLGFESFVAFGDTARPTHSTHDNDTGLRDGTDGAHDNLWDAEPVEAGPDPAAYGPALRARYHAGFLDRTTLKGLAPPLGARTGLLLPVADRDPAHPGLDSFDMVGNGDPDEVLLRGYWDMSRSGGARERLSTGGTFVGAGNASTADLLWLQSRAFTLAPGVALQFFDHGLRFEGSDADGPRFTLLDHRREGAPVALATVADVQVETAGCIAVRWDHRARGTAEPCGGLQVAPTDAHTSPTDDDVLWWVEVQGASDEAVTLVMNRVVTTVDRAPAGDDRHMWVGGQLYSWDDLRIDGDRVEEVGLSHLLPLAGPLEIALPDGAPLRVQGPAAGALLPLFPPFDEEHTTLQIHDVAVERGPDGFLDGRGDPDDTDAVLAGRATRLETTGPLEVRTHGVHSEPRHHFLLLDPVRGWDPARSGTAFVNGYWAEPWADHPAPDAGHAALAVEGPGAFEEALRRGDDRGWDRSVQVTIEGPSRVVLDSARLGRSGLTARVVDQGAGQPGGTTATGPAPGDPLLVREADRPSGLWVFRFFEPTDLYVGFLEGDARPTPTEPTPTGVPDRTPGTTVPWPTRTTEPTGTSRDGPLGLPVVILALLAAVVIARARRG